MPLAVLCSCTGHGSDELHRTRCRAQYSDGLQEANLALVQSDFEAVIGRWECIPSLEVVLARTPLTAAQLTDFHNRRIRLEIDGSQYWLVSSGRDGEVDTADDVDVTGLLPALPSCPPGW